MRSGSGFDYQWVTERIALGSAVAGPLQVRAMMGDGITHVLDVRVEASSERLYAGTGIQYLQNGVPDDGKPKADAWFWKGIDFVAGALRRSPSKALVHCRLGMSRSPTMVFAILRAQGVPAEEATRLIKAARIVARVSYPEDAERAGRTWRPRRS
jgi:protein-tyrosine phosphatase